MSENEGLIHANISYAKTGLKFIDDMWGGMPLRTPVAFVGATRAGKTLLSLQLAVKLATGVEGNILAIRSETSFDTIAKSWFPKFIERYCKNERHRPHLYILSAIDMRQLLALHGDKVRIRFRSSGGSGKMEFDILETSETSKVREMIRNNSISVVIYDSLTAPIHRSFPAKRENFPARADAIKRLCYHMLYLCDEFPIFLIATHHESRDPANPFGKPFMASESTLGYEFGFIMYIEKLRDGRPSTRRIWNIRSPTIPEWGACRYCVIDDYGFWDLESEDQAKGLHSGRYEWDFRNHRVVEGRKKRRKNERT